MFRKITILLTLFALAGLAAAPAVAKDDPGFVQFRGSSFPVKEEAGEVTVVVKRQRGGTGAVTVDWVSTDGSAEDGEDYEAATGTLEWADGDRGDRRFTVLILDDDVAEGQETFGVLLLNPTGDVEVGAVSSAVVRIKPSDADSDDDGGDDDSDDGNSDDDLAGLIKLTNVVFPAFESTGEATVVAERTGGSAGSVSVDYATIDGSAVAPDDYLASDGVLTWADGEIGQKSVSVPLIDDDENEELETITFFLTHATGGAKLGVRDVGSIVIIDETLCLRDGRFQVTGTWRDFQGQEGPFHMVPATDGAGLVWFFNEENVEVLLKVLDGCPLNGYFWVFFAASSNVEFTMEVVDLQAGVTRTYVNPLGVVPLATTDVTAFATCP